VRHVASPVREQTVEAIREQIMNGSFAEGQRLVERELCEQLQVSRNTLREAYRQLEAEGFVEIRPHRGPTVTILSKEEAKALYEVREAMEGLAIRLFTERASATQLAELEDTYVELEAAYATGEVGAMLHTKDRFYELLYKGASNEALRAYARVLQGRLSRLRSKSLSTGSRPLRSIAEIEGVMTHIKARDAEAASRAWCAHIRNAAAVVEESFEQAAS
jgi:DNA-binding GntR family transcriptional regulator